MRLARTLAYLAVAVASALPGAPVNAQTIAELAQKAVYEQCPELLYYDGPLADDATIKALGYEYARSISHPRVGQIDIVEINKPNEKIFIGNSSDASFCQVGLQGPNAKSAFDAVYAAIDQSGYNFYREEFDVQGNAGVKTITLRTDALDELGGFYLGIQFIDPTGVDTNAPLIIQQYALQE